MDEALDQAEVVFVGTVVELENSRRWAMVEVSEIWKGDVVPGRVEVRVGPKDPPGPGGVATSVDRYYKLGREYLFVPFRGRGTIFRDNACTASRLFTERLERFRPVGSEEPTPSPSASSSEVVAAPDPIDPAFWWVMAGAVVAILIGGVLWLRSSKSS
jgi:hypothetical protein